MLSCSSYSRILLSSKVSSTFKLGNDIGLLKVMVKLPVFEKSQPGSTSVVKHAHRTITCTESWLPYEIRIKRNGVQSIGFTDLDGLLKQESGPKYAAFSAHPIIDPETEEMFFFSRNGGPGAMPRILYG